MIEKIRVMIADDSEETRQCLRLLLGFAERVDIVGEARDGAQALELIAQLDPHVILMDINMPVLDGVQATQRICRQFPDIAVVVISVQNDLEYVRQCMRAGAKDYLFKPVSTDLLIETVETVARTRLERLTRGAVPQLPERMVRSSRVISLVSAKGGVGKTTLAVNIAATLAAQGKRVALADFDLQFGDASLMFNITPDRTVVELVRESNEIDPDVLDNYLVAHSTGVHLLSAPKRPEDMEYVTAQHLRSILQALREKFDYVVVDSASVANDHFFAILECSDQSLMTSTLNLAVLKNNRMLLDLLIEMGYDTSLIKHVLNRSNAKNGLKSRDVVKVLRADVFAEIENEYQFVESSVNQGMPFVLRDKQHRLSRQLFDCIGRLEDAKGVQVSRRNPLRKLMLAKR